MTTYVVFVGLAEKGMALLRQVNDEFRVPVGMIPVGLKPGEVLAVTVRRKNDARAD